MSKNHAEFRIFVEGGTKGRLADACRRGFGRFFEKAGLGQRKPRIVSCGTRRAAYEDFCHALARADKKDIYLLLVDSETEITVTKEQVWTHVKARQGDGWDQPAGADANMLHFMVECMENWLLADTHALLKYFGQGFRVDVLPKNKNVENITKAEAYAALEAATAKCKTKRPYAKGEHSFALMERIDPTMVEGAGEFAKRVIDKVIACSNLSIR